MAIHHIRDYLRLPRHPDGTSGGVIRKSRKAEEVKRMIDNMLHNAQRRLREGR